MKVTTEKANEARGLRKLIEIGSDRMLTRLLERMLDGERGWDDPNSDYDFEGRAIYHIKSGNYIDAANICLMMWNRQG